MMPFRWPFLILNDGCVFEEGVCHTIHLPGKLGGPICLDNYQSTYYRRDGRPIDEADARRLQHNEADYRRWLWYRFSNGFMLTPEGLPWGPCGLCANPALRAAGIAAIKIAGREGATERKLACVGMVRQTLNRALAGARVLGIARRGTCATTRTSSSARSRTKLRSSRDLPRDEQRGRVADAGDLDAARAAGEDPEEPFELRRHERQLSELELPLANSPRFSGYRPYVEFHIMQRVFSPANAAHRVR